jgi:flagellar M-ring protein FliF
MNKLSQTFKNLFDKWKSLSKNKKIVTGIIFGGILAALIVLGTSIGSTKYDVLFSNMNATDAAAVYKQLQTDKVSAKVVGSSILVPSNQVDQVRMQILSEVTMTNGSQGFELLDKNQFGMTDQQFKVDYQRALQGELERTIKGFSEVENARVHLVLPDDTQFVKDTSPGSASVTLQLKPGVTLTDDQVKAIIALISGSVKNVPKQNVQVIDDKMNLLSQGLFDGSNSGDTSNATTSTDKQQQLKEEYENDVKNNLLNMLEAVYGKGKVKVNINADLNFDAVQQETTTYDPKSVIVSEHNIKDTAPGSGTTTSTASPVDNNMTNSIVNNTTTTGNGVAIHEENTTNYDVSKVEQKTIKAPGSVQRITASVALDGNLSPATATAIKNLVASAIGYDATRGDSISVEGIPFDKTYQINAKNDLNAMNQAAAQSAKFRMYTMIGVGAAVLIGALIAFILWRRRRSEDQLLQNQIGPQGIDVIIGDDDEIKQQPRFKPMNFEQENEKTHIENEIKKYAKEKPEQVVDIVKSWLTEDER